MGLFRVSVITIAKVYPQGVHSAQKIIVPCLYGNVKIIVFVIRPGQGDDIPCILDFYHYGYRIRSVRVLIACRIANLNIVF